jgi:signal transduction histidine kinase
MDKADETLDGNRLRIAVQQGFPPDVKSQRDAVSLGQELAGRVIVHDEPLIVPDLLTDPHAGQVPGIEAQTAYVGVPIRAGKRVLGALGILKERGQPQLNVNEISLLTSIADHVGVVVESARLRQQAEQMAVLEERGRLARELHDSVTQSLYSLTLFAKWGQDLFADGELEEVEQRLIRIGEVAQQALKEMRLLVYELRPAMLEQDGLVNALRRRLDAVERRAGLKVSIQAESMGKLPGPVERGLYRIAQEALNNALKHATANSVTLRLFDDGKRVMLEVEDDGTGFAPDGVDDKGGLGLVSMQERAEKLGGVLTVTSAPGEGTTVKVELENLF